MATDSVTTAAKKRLFLLDYAQHGNVWYAAKNCKMTRQAHYVWLESDEQYKRDFEDAKQDAIDAIEDEIRRRATRKKAPSDTLLIFLAKKLNPEFRDNYKVQRPAAASAPPQIKVVFHQPDKP